MLAGVVDAGRLSEEDTWDVGDEEASEVGDEEASEAGDEEASEVRDDEASEVTDEEGPEDIEEPEIKLNSELGTIVAIERSEQVVQFAEVELAV